MFDSDAKVKKDLDVLVEGMMRLSPEELCGIAQILGVPLKNPENGEVWDAEEFLLRICTAFCEKKRRQRKNLLKIVNVTVEGRPLVKKTEE